jgi:hypothetical protein
MTRARRGSTAWRSTASSERSSIPPLHPHLEADRDHVTARPVMEACVIHEGTSPLAWPQSKRKALNLRKGVNHRIDEVPVLGLVFGIVGRAIALMGVVTTHGGDP